MLEVAYEEIIEELRAQWGIQLSASIARSHAPTANAKLVRCENCKLEYFRGAVAGSADFYAELSAAFQYEDERWEFTEVAKHLTKDDLLADLGAGTGIFLGSVRDRVAAVVGVDHNRPAVAALRCKGLEGHAVPFEEFARARPHAFSVVTAFHLIEHIPDVAELIQPAVQLLRPGGRLFISAPNAERIRGHDQLEPLDCPPHHVSRWRAEQWWRLAELFDLHVVSVSFEPPPIISYERVIQGSLTKRGLGWLARPLLAVLWRSGVTHRSYARRAGSEWFTARDMYGHSMLAEFRT